MASSWVPDVENEQWGPLYWRIATALARDIRSGRLTLGERLPTHRALAYNLGVTVNTVSKAYAEAERDGLIVSRTGRGTYVKGFPEELADRSAGPNDVIDFSANTPSSAPFNSIFNQLFGALSRRGSLHGLLEHHPHPGLERHRAAGARWIQQRGIGAEPSRVIICNGAQEATLATLACIARPGDTVLTEALNYAGLRHVGHMLRINLRGVETDSQGLVPDSLAKACQDEKVVAIVTTPTNQNPTTAFAPVERRKAMAEIAKRAGALLIEDDIFGHLFPESEVPTLTALAPDNCVYICGVSKCISVGLRVGYVLPPPALLSEIVQSLHSISASSPALMAELMALLIEGEHTDHFLSWHRREAQERFEIARDILGLNTAQSRPSYHVWVPLPEPLRANDFVADVRSKGVLVSPSSRYAVDQNPPPEAIRVALGSERDRNRLSEGLKVIAQSTKDSLNRINSVRADSKAS